MKKWVFSIIIVFLLVVKVSGQTYTQTFIDKCSGEVKLVKTTYVNGNAVISFYDQIRTFSPVEVQNGVVQAWLQSVYLRYSTLACPTAQVVQQTVTQAVSQAASSAA